jgi:tetratricopeptide (TPR) repeat protein
MTYAGDSELSEPIRQRVEETYHQSQQLAADGKTQEATLGCEFVLRLDPLYEPARELLNRLQIGDEPVPPESAGLADAPDDVADAREADFQLASPAFSSASPAAPSSASSASSASGLDLRSEFADLLERRDFRTLLSLAEEHRSTVVGDLMLAAQVGMASERLEAEPYLRTFVEGAERAHRAGRDEEARALIEKARALDPSHPALPPERPKSGFVDSNDRIRELLEEGQRAVDRSDYQGAIDSWSRIFLIDIDHSEATRRIEMARRLKAESERKIEEAFHEGVAQWELGATDKAREQFEKVLALAPTHVGAKDYLERLDSREAVANTFAAGPQPSGDEEIPVPPDSLAFARRRAPQQRHDDEPVVAEDAELVFDDEPPPTREKPATTVEGKRGNRRFATLAGLGALLLLAAFAALYLKRDVFFPNSDQPLPVAQIDVLARARKMHAAGQSEMAMASLRRVSPEDAQYAEAQALIAQWEAPAVVEEVPAGPSVDQLALRDELVLRAQRLRENREYLRAATHYAAAAKIAPLEAPDQLLQEEIRQRLAGLEDQIRLFEQGDWEFVVPELWRLHTANPEDKDVVRLMVDSYYNLGVRDLQRGDSPAAVEKFERAAELDAADPDVVRLLRFGQVYSERPADLLYRIFVKYLPFR